MKLKTTDQVEVVFYDTAYNELVRKAVPMEQAGKDQITKVEPYKAGESEWIKGTLTYDRAALIGVEVNGVMYHQTI
ncbi:hypothetical protein [Enterococcus lactis]|uniref:hypothetical protein n=1 Tax=Enterococcus lactis TaxID=357441 RepID=UPI0040420946